MASSMSGSETDRSSGSTESEQLYDEFPPERLEPMAKMSQVGVSEPSGSLQGVIPVMFKRKLFQDEPHIHDPSTTDTTITPHRQVHHRPSHHMRAQPRGAYSTMDPAQQQQAEMLDTCLARQQLLIRQQQQVEELSRQQQIDQQAQHLINQAIPPHPTSTNTTTTTTPATDPQAERQVLTSLLNEACFLAPQPAVGAPGFAQGMVGMGYPQGFAHGFPQAMAAPAMYRAAPGAPPVGFPAMNQAELMQAVRSELKRLQQQ